LPQEYLWRPAAKSACSVATRLLADHSSKNAARIREQDRR